ncbi:hypothetical protein [Rhodocyclus tenuis]|uniref:DUF551 domain-containing protein n=1 Tax=Rhodocyclus tenuis TaxID=1066 RepID=A0A840G3R3_RHOTE|nr:hypothetical protein [Rhodocyclus tenuis]MBB4246535.1 hypothetical protein [Rhodocyclus tenuis]
MITETIIWHPTAEQLPDSDTTVLITGNVEAGNVWLGYLDGEQWRNADGWPIDPPTAWATMPAGLEAAQEPLTGVRCEVVKNCKSCRHSFGRLSCALAGRDFDSLTRATTPPDWCPLPVYTAAFATAEKGGAV